MRNEDLIKAIGEFTEELKKNTETQENLMNILYFYQRELLTVLIDLRKDQNGQ